MTRLMLGRIAALVAVASASVHVISLFGPGQPAWWKLLLSAMTVGCLVCARHLWRTATGTAWLGSFAMYGVLLIAHGSGHHNSGAATALVGHGSHAAATAHVEHGSHTARMAQLGDSSLLTTAVPASELLMWAMFALAGIGALWSLRRPEKSTVRTS